MVEADVQAWTWCPHDGTRVVVLLDGTVAADPHCHWRGHYEELVALVAAGEVEVVDRGEEG
jgi:hypothetical protein